MAFETNLAALVNAPAAAPAGSAPVLAPPIYGQWPAARKTVTPGATPWLDRFNLDPRWRIAAAFGTRVVQQNQEALMASAWDQVADAINANQRLRQMQMACQVGKVLHDRHFKTFTDEKMMRIAGPGLARLGLQGGGVPMLAQQAGSPLPLGANRSAMRRIGRHRGPISRRTAGQGVPRDETQSWVHQLMTGSIPAAASGPPPMAFATWPPLPTATQLKTGSQFGVFFVQPENVTPTFPGTPVPDSRLEWPGFFRAAALDNLTKFFPARPAATATTTQALDKPASKVLALTDPTKTLPQLAKSLFATGDNLLPATVNDVSPTGLETLMFRPQFPTAMYEPLREISQDLFLPGVETVNPETVLALQTNQPFVEAYLVGLNHEMARELLWRGFPTDQRGTYFSNFWSDRVAGAKGEIDDLTTWSAQRSLGASAATGGQFVLLLRSRLLSRYPNAVIYLAPAMASATTPGGYAPDLSKAAIMPTFSGALDPDLRYFGFPVAAATAVALPGCFLVIQQHPTEPRFGIETNSVPAGTSYLSSKGPLPAGMTWGPNAAQMAAQTLQRPARVALHASRLIVTA